MILVIKQVQKLISLLILWVSLPIFLLITNPERLPLPLLVVPFVIFGAALMTTAYTALGILPGDLPRRRRKVVSVIVAVLPTLLIVLASIRQLTIRDTAIVIGLLIALVFYLRRIDFLKT